MTPMPRSRESFILSSLKDSSELKLRIAEKCTLQITRSIDILLHALRSGKKVLLCGNGGSAADAQHLATEFVIRLDPGITAGLFLEWARVHEHLYATPSRFVDEGVKAGRVVVLDVDVQGGASVRRARPRAVSVFVYPPSLGSLRARLESRGTDKPEVIEERMRNAPGEMAQAMHYDYIIMKDDLERAQAALVAIHDTELARVRGVVV